MKKIIAAIIVMVLCNSAFSQYKGSKSADTKPNVIKINPLGLIFGQASVGYERAFGEKNSIVLAPSFGGFKFSGFKYSQVGFGAEYRFYLSNTKTAPAGFYAAPGVGFSSGKIKEDGASSDAKFTSFAGKVIIGNQWIFSSGFVLDLNGGIQYSSFSYTNNQSSIFNGLKGSGVFPTVGLSLGYNF